MSQFDDNFAAGSLPALMEVHGQTITYTPVTGSAVSLTAIVGEVNSSIDDEDDGRTEHRERMVTIMTDPSSSFGGVAAPSHADSVTIDSEVWAVDVPGKERGHSVELRVVRTPIVERSREGYRSSP